MLRAFSSLGLACPSAGRVGSALSVSGALARGAAGARVGIIWQLPPGATGTAAISTQQTARSGPGGRFTDSFSPTAPGRWLVSAEWLGDPNHEPAHSQVCTLEVAGGTPTPTPATTPTPTPPPPTPTPTPPPTPQSSSLSIGCTPATVYLPAGNETVSGSLSPTLGGATITIDYKAQDSTLVKHSVSTQANGSFSDSFTPSLLEKWTAQAHFIGNASQTAADSPTCSFSATTP